MTVKELKKVLNDLDEDTDVVIIAKEDYTVFVADIKCVCGGTYYVRGRDRSRQIKCETSEPMIGLLSNTREEIEKDPTCDSYYFKIELDNTFYQDKK